jgi:SNF2 family DNA or RNA helicase
MVSCRLDYADAQVDFTCPGLLGSYKQFNKHYEKPILKSREVGASPALIENGKMKAEEVSLIGTVSMTSSRVS